MIEFKKYFKKNRKIKRNNLKKLLKIINSTHLMRSIIWLKKVTQDEIGRSLPQRKHYNPSAQFFESVPFFVIKTIPWYYRGRGENCSIFKLLRPATTYLFVLSRELVAKIKVFSVEDSLSLVLTRFNYYFFSRWESHPLLWEDQYRLGTDENSFRFLKKKWRKFQNLIIKIRYCEGYLLE